MRGYWGSLEMRENEQAQRLRESYEMMVESVRNGRSLAEQVGMGQAELDLIYNLGYQEYSGGDYRGAERTFMGLCTLDQKAERNWFGLGAARQKLKNYQGALSAYAWVVNLGFENPQAVLHAAECMLALGWLDDAKGALNQARGWASKVPNPEAVRTHADVLDKALAVAESRSAAIAGEQGA